MKGTERTANVLCFAAVLMCAAAVMWSGCQGANDLKKDIEHGNTGTKILLKYDETVMWVWHETEPHRYSQLSPNSEVLEGTSLLFESKNLPDGKQVDKWQVNTKELTDDKYTVNSADAVTEGGQKVITVAYTTKAAEAIVIRFNESTITVQKSGGKRINSGDTVYEGHWMRFRAVNLPAGQQVDKWKINDRELNGSRYTINSADAVTEGGQKVITLAYTTKPAEAIVIRFNENELEVHRSGSSEFIYDRDTIYEGAGIWFNAINLLPGQQVDKWKINDKELNDAWYTINSADAVTEGGQKVITVTYTTKAAEAIVIKFDKNKIEVHKSISDESIHNGDIIYEGTKIWFRAVNLPAGQQVDKWKINDRELNDAWYTINSADAIPEGGQKVITLAYTTKPAEAIVIRFNENELEVHRSGSSEFIHNGDTMYEGADIWFRAVNLPAGQQVDKWTVNDKKLNGYRYTIDIADTVTEGGQKVITVTYTTKAAEAIVVRFNENDIKVYKNGSGSIKNGASVDEGSRLLFYTVNLPARQQVDKWKINDRKLNYDWYTVNSADTVTEGGQKVITVAYTTKAAEAIVIKFDKNKIEVYKEGEDTPIQDGDTVYEGTPIWFGMANLAEGIPAGQTFNGWTINGKEYNDSAYTVTLADAVTEGSQKVITISYTAKLGTDPVVIKFDPAFVRVYHRDANTPVQNGQTLYAGTELRIRKRKVNAINKWLINTKEYWGKSSAYSINSAHAIEENGQKVIRISFTVSPVQMMTVQFDPALIECKTVTGKTITSGYEGPAYLYAILTAKLPSGKKVKHWEINGRKIPGSEGRKTLEGQADPDFAVEENGKKVIKVNLVVE